MLAVHAARAIERAQLYSAVEQGQHRAEEQRDQLQVILDSLPSGILIYALPDAQIEMSNETARAFVRGAEAGAYPVPQAALPYRLSTLEGRRADRGATIPPGARCGARRFATPNSSWNGWTARVFPSSCRPVRCAMPMARSCKPWSSFRTSPACAKPNSSRTIFSRSSRMSSARRLTAINGGARLLADAGDAIDQ